MIAVLAEEQRSLTLHDLVKPILKYNEQPPIEEVSKERLKRTRLTLHHVHLPKLASAGLVEYDQERQLVEPTEEFDQLRSDLVALLAHDPHIDEPVAL